MMTIKGFYRHLFLVMFALFLGNGPTAEPSLKTHCPPPEESGFEMMKKEMLAWEKQLDQELAGIEVVGRGKTVAEENRARQIRGLLLNLDNIQKVLVGKKTPSFPQSF